MPTSKVWFLMQVLHVQLNAHSEGLVSNVGIAYSIKCSQWKICLWCKYYIHGYMDIVKVINSKMLVSQLYLNEHNERLIYDANITYLIKCT
jgi:hypothetical protein